MTAVDKAVELRALADLIKFAEFIKYEAGQYADGADDAHYLAKEMANFEAKATSVLHEISSVREISQ